MRSRHLAFTVSLAISGCLMGSPARATEGGASLFLPGLRGPLAGVVPPPGFYFSNDLYTYSGELGGSRRTQIGGAIVANIKVEARVDFATVSWVTPLEILGGHLGFGVSLPFGVPRVTAGALIQAPRIERTLSFSQRDATFNLGDPVLLSFIGWNTDKFHWSIGGIVNIPGGAYQEDELSNLAFNRWIGDVYAALTYLDPEIGLDISGAVGFEINGTNPATDYASGNAVHVDFAISKYLSKELSVGVLAGYYDQVSGDSGAGNGIGPFKGRVAAVGGTAEYTFPVGGTPVSARLKVLREVDVENRSQGTMGLFTIAFPLGGAAPPTPKPISVKY